MRAAEEIARLTCNKEKFNYRLVQRKEQAEAAAAQRDSLTAAPSLCFQPQKSWRGQTPGQSIIRRRAHTNTHTDSGIIIGVCGCVPSVPAWPIIYRRAPTKVCDFVNVYMEWREADGRAGCQREIIFIY